MLLIKLNGRCQKDIINKRDKINKKINKGDHDQKCIAFLYDLAIAQIMLRMRSVTT